MQNKKQSNKLLTEVELELMSILWRIGEGSVSDVIEQLPKDRELAYTSVSTILRILEQKSVLSVRKEGRGHIYIPVLEKSDYEAKTVKHVIERVFDGAAVVLVRQLLDSGNVGEKELAELRKLISEYGSKT
jgi:predicted transcriptional regulator